jgi:hypothetical protein
MLFTTVYQFPKTPPTCEVATSVCFGWFQVLGPSLVGVQQQVCVMFGITGTGLGSTRLFSWSWNPRSGPRRDSPPGGCGTRYTSSQLSRHISSINEACKL